MRISSILLEGTSTGVRPVNASQQVKEVSMGYLKDFQTQIANHDYPALLRLWEEYCASDEIDPEELYQILKSIKGSEIAEPFGRHVEKILPLWENLSSSDLSYQIIKLIFDLATTNSEALAQLACDYLKQKYPDDSHFNDKMRLIGLRSKEKFQGAISSYELLTHIQKGNFVFHTGGWGVGEIVDVSLIREQLSVEFDYVPGKKDISFANAFKTLIPIPKDHFLALRFGNPDLLESKARENPVEVMRMLLRDLGPKTAAEIKDELCDLVIPANEWTRWWQNARAKIKKDTIIETPLDLKEPFRLRGIEVSHEERLQKALETRPDANALILMIYSFLRDFSEILKNQQFKETLIAKLLETQSSEELSNAQELQLHFILQDLGSEPSIMAISELIQHFPSIEEIVEKIEIIAFKKRLLVGVRKYRPDWEAVFLNLLTKVEQNTLRDYLFQELNHPQTLEPLKQKLQELLQNPSQNPEAFLWYFQKINSQGSIPFSNAEGKTRFFESYLVLMHHLEALEEKRELLKKMHALLSNERYAIVRQIMQASSKEDVQEFLLLLTKCYSLSDHDIKIFYSLAEVAHPSLGKIKKKQEAGTSSDTQVIWTTAEGYKKLQQRIQQIATVETVLNAKEIETARSHGDLRENAEFKAALEKRDRLQSELKFLSDQLNASRIITKEDIVTDNIDIGCVVECENKRGEKAQYTILGPFDADPEKHILSFQSKLAQTMKGLKIGGQFEFQGDRYTVLSIRAFL